MRFWPILVVVALAWVVLLCEATEAERPTAVAEKAPTPGVSGAKPSSSGELGSTRKRRHLWHHHDDYYYDYLDPYQGNRPCGSVCLSSRMCGMGCECYGFPVGVCY